MFVEIVEGDVGRGIKERRKFCRIGRRKIIESVGCVWFLECKFGVEIVK